MHRRNSSRLPGVDRRKSTSSVKSVQLAHILPEMAERDAQVAASQAFARARERTSTDAVLWPPPRGSSSGRPTPERHRNESSIRREQSVRFIQPRSSQFTSSYSPMEDLTPTRPPGTARLKGTGNGIETRPASSASAAGMVSAAKGAAGDYINALITGEEYYTPEDNIASAPSSYRRIRKSRSMFTSSEVGTISGYNVDNQISSAANPASRPSITSRTAQADENIPPAVLKAPKSMSFLRSRRDQSLQFYDDDDDRAVSPTNEFTKPTNGKGKFLKSQPSLLFRPKQSTADRALRKSMRDISDSTISTTGKMSKEGSLRRKARKVSQNFKHKLKNFFALGKGDGDEDVFPPQQVEARKHHNTDLDSPEDDPSDEFQLATPADECALSRVTSGIPSLHAVPSCQQLRSRQGSVESLRSERNASDEKSRVSSWTNSDVNTLNTMSSSRGEWERQRLSVIKENGAHMSSSSAKRPALSNPFSQSSNSSIPQPPPVQPRPGAVDSQRIYSALMKRLSETERQQHELKRQQSAENFRKFGVAPPRGSSRSCGNSALNTPTTIRHVMPDSVSDSSSVRTIERKPVTQTVGLGEDSHESQYPAEHELSTSVSAPRANGEAINNPTLSVPHPRESLKRTLSSRSSAFFGSPSRHLFRTRSPYRRALQDTMSTATQEQQPKSPDFNPWMCSISSLPMRCPSTCESDIDQKIGYAESIYSSNTDDQLSEMNNTLSLVDNFPKPPSAHGDATIFVDPPTYKPTPPAWTEQRVSSSASSVEWKTWLSANVSRLKETSMHPVINNFEYDLPSTRPSGHIREKAQINDEDGDPELEVYQPTRPSSALALTDHDSDTSRRSQSTLEDMSFASVLMKDDVFRPPPLPPKSNLRSALSHSSMRFNGETFETGTTTTDEGVSDSIRGNSLARVSSLNAIPGNQSLGGKPVNTKPIQIQPLSRDYNTPGSSPGLSNAVKQQFGKQGGSPRSKQRLNIVTPTKSENVSPHMTDSEDPYRIDGAGVLGPNADTDLQAMGSKKIVDLFLSSRRRRIASDSEDGRVFL